MELTDLAKTDALYAVAVGSPFDGLTIYGPFPDSESADDFAGSIREDWWIVYLEPVRNEADDPPASTLGKDERR